MADLEAILDYLKCQEVAAEIISKALEYVQQTLMNDSNLNVEQKLEKIRDILQSSRVALKVLGHADKAILGFVSDLLLILLPPLT